MSGGTVEDLGRALSKSRMVEQTSLAFALRMLDAIAYDWRSKLIRAVETDDHEKLDATYEEWYKRLREAIAEVREAAAGEFAYLGQIVEQWKAIPSCANAAPRMLCAIEERQLNCLAQMVEVIEQFRGGK